MIKKIPRFISLSLLLLLIGEACVDRIDINSEGSEQNVIVVNGFISDQPGPYTVRLFRTTTTENILQASIPVIARSVIIFDDLGNQEELTASEEGVYRTAVDGLRGEVGRSYSVRIEMVNGKILQSIPDRITAGGSIESIYQQWESVTLVDGSPRSGFRVFIDGNARPGAFTRWKYSGTYMAESFPELNKFQPNCFEPPPPTPDPLPCSGYITTGIRTRSGLTIGELIQVGDCTCCQCWVVDAEDKPTLNNTVISTHGKYSGIEVGYVPFNEWTFAHRKFMVKVEQMSLSEGAYEFWKTIADQKNGSSSLFQPPFGKPTTNLSWINSDQKVIGYFYATSISKKVLFLTPDDAPVPVPDPFKEPKDNCALWRDCASIFPFSSYSKPEEWED